ncbi:DUF4145 domain-containing protein [Polymorphobacter sp. PAMC 29334]|nr:DUF4145 domain-containing protein [Polymorphobacter sp. PAMC 29334]
MSFFVLLDKATPNGYYIPASAPLFAKRVLPNGTSKPQPEYIPAALREDYIEACKIKDDSPKAAATLARRCLQGMIRDFCGIAKSTLDQEIKALDTMLSNGTSPLGVSAESILAIDQVRGIGNIGAHMERDINLIINVEPDEAQALIELIELLFEEWYVSRRKRQKNLERISEIATAKKKAIADGRGASALALPSPEGA